MYYSSNFKTSCYTKTLVVIQNNENVTNKYTFILGKIFIAFYAYDLTPDSGKLKQGRQRLPIEIFEAGEKTQSKTRKSFN